MSFPKQVAPRSPVINRDSGSTLYRHSGQDPSAETGQECCRSRFENFHFLELWKQTRIV